MGVVTLFECGHVRPSLRFSGRPCTHGFPRGHCLASMGSNLCCGAVGLGWDEEVSEGLSGISCTGVRLNICSYALAA
ncbi:hypothetical protein E0H72_33985 [Rhizobium leguminosarum bv. viciae]|nr:hypothetical protein [Rhizobium leguminosarum bv. viciae]TCA31736.1 hypothetical protein E0H72_33985 [Rhizobium leguminosarum bv. viciae]